MNNWWLGMVEENGQQLYDGTIYTIGCFYRDDGQPDEQAVVAAHVEDEEAARFIVRACNAHEELLGALEIARSLLHQAINGGCVWHKGSNLVEVERGLETIDKAIKEQS